MAGLSSVQRKTSVCRGSLQVRKRVDYRDRDIIYSCSDFSSALLVPYFILNDFV